MTTVTIHEVDGAYSSTMEGKEPLRITVGTAALALSEAYDNGRLVSQPIQGADIFGWVHTIAGVPVILLDPDPLRMAFELGADDCIARQYRNHYEAQTPEWAMYKAGWNCAITHGDRELAFLASMGMGETNANE